jgi:hypothetical protein
LSPQNAAKERLRGRKKRGSIVVKEHNEKFKFDQTEFFEAWRFNSQDCLLDEREKKELIFLDKKQSLSLWAKQDKLFEQYRHLMLIPRERINIVEKATLDFDDIEAGEIFFKKHCNEVSMIIFFWGPQHACIAPFDIFVKSWTDFFYPSDENSIIYIPNSSISIFSHNETFFAATFN